MPSSRILKRISFIPIALVLFLFSFEGISTYASPAGENLTEENKRPALSGGYFIYLPLTSKDYCLACDAIPSPFSISIADLFNADFPSQVQALKDSGAGWTRINLDWWRIEQNDPGGGSPVYTWTLYDNKFGLVTAAGLRPIVIVNGVPGWAGSPGCPAISSDHWDEFSQFLTDLVNRYKQSPYFIHHWEITNEPDVVGAGFSNCWGNVGSEYADMLATAYPAIKAADPQATVLMGGIAYDGFTEYGGPFNRYFPDDVMSGGGSPYLDALNFHYFPDFHLEWERWNSSTPTCGNVEDGQGLPYSGAGTDVIAKFNHLRNRMQTCFGVTKPIWITEVGEHSYETVSLNKSATASSTESSYLPVKAVDGVLTASGWRSLPSAGDPQWIQIDLGATHLISSVILRWETAYGKSYQIQTSNDATNWTDIYSTTAGDGGVDNLAISGSGRYIRMYGTQSGTSNGYALVEFEVHSNTSASLARQARYVLQVYARGLAAGAKNITWYALRIDPGNAANYVSEQMLLNDDLSPRPAFEAYQTMTAELKGYQYNRTTGVVGGGEAYVFRSPYPKEKTVAWGAGTLTFSPATQLRVVDRQGTATFINDGYAGDLDGVPNGSVKLQLSTEPVFIQVVS